MNLLHVLADELDRLDQDDDAAVTLGQLRELVRRAGERYDAYERDADF